MTTASPQHLRRVFVENFSAADIAEPLASFDASTTAADVLAGSPQTDRAPRKSWTGIRRPDAQQRLRSLGCPKQAAILTRF